MGYLGGYFFDWKHMPAGRHAPEAPRKSARPVILSQVTWTTPCNREALNAPSRPLEQHSTGGGHHPLHIMDA